MKLFIVGYDSTLSTVKKFIMKHYDDIQFGLYSTTLDVHSLILQIQQAEQKYDGVLFTGKTPYDIAISHIVPKKPWIFIRKQGTQLLHILLEAAVMKQYNIRKISIDQPSQALFDPKFLEQTLHQIGIKPSELQLHYIYTDTTKENMLSDLAQKHEALYQSGVVSFCLTSLSSLEKLLQQRGVPVLCIRFDEQSIDDAITQLRLLHLQNKNTHNSEIQMAMIEIKNDAESFEGVMRQRTSLLSRMEILDEIISVSNRMGGALIETGNNQFCLIFHSKPTSITKDNRSFCFEDAPHIIKIAQQKDIRINIGIGVHANLRQCRQHSLRALAACRQAKTAAAFFCDETGKCLGPLHSVSVFEQSTGPILYSDELAQNISLQTGVHTSAIETIFKLNLSKKNGEFSSHDFANTSGTSTRNANRLLSVLEEHRIIELVGQRTYPGGGRPIRIFRLCI